MKTHVLAGLQGFFRPASAPRQLLHAVLDNSLYLVTLGLFAFFAFKAPFFLSTQNLMNILVSASFMGIVAAGYTITLLTGQIDMSVGTVIAVVSVVTGLLFQKFGWPVALVVPIALISSALIGLINGVLVVDLKIQAFIATLATSGVFLGIGWGVVGGQWMSITRPELQEILLQRPLTLPLSVWFMLLCYVAGYILLNQTKLGAHIYAVGGNAQAASLNGVDVGRVIRVALLILAFTVGVSAIFATARAGTTLVFGAANVSQSGARAGNLIGAANTAGDAGALTAVLLGGVSLYGGVGRIERNLVAVLFLAILGNGLDLLHISAGVWLIVQGIALIGAVILQVVRRRMEGPGY